MLKVAIIPPTKNGDYLLDTIVDGLISLISEGKNIEIKILNGYPSPIASELESFFAKEDDFVEYAKNYADIIFLCFRYKELNIKVAEKINRWDKTLFLDGSEYKHNNRLDFNIQYKVLNNSYDGPGAFNFSINSKAALYLRREKPYIENSIPTPFGIERRFISYEKGIKKDIDFACMFGQDDYPVMRKHCKSIIKDFCDRNNFSCYIGKTKGFSHDLNKVAGREEFYSILSRSKVGVSVGGGGFDTLRFWETLANNCILLTEKIDIYNPDDRSLEYQRVYQFNNLFDFKYQLEKLGNYLKNNYQQDSLDEEYNKILDDHSTKSRVIFILKEAKKRGIINFEPF